MNNLIELFKTRIAALDTVTIIQLATVFLVLTLLYRFLYLRRSFSIATGIVIMYCLYMCAGIFKLNYIHGLLDPFVKHGAILLMLVFASEIQSVFENFGNFFLVFRCKPQDKKTAHELAEAVETLSSTKTGAIIIIEKKTKLEHITKKAEILDANLSKNLLLNIFSSQGPLHDGAVLIRNGRIYAASCKIPNATGTTLPSHYGSRHQSSVNLSSASEAFILIVSEEDATVSYAENGQLKHFTNMQEMYDMIYAAMYVKGYRKKAKKNQDVSINLRTANTKSKKSK